MTNRELAGVLRNFFYFDTQNAFCFNDENVIDFLDIYEKMCSAHDVFEKNKIKRLHRYCTFAIDQYIRNIFIKKNPNWKKIRKILRQKFKKIDFVQLIVIFSYLKTLKNTRRIEFNDVFRFIKKYSVVFNQFLTQKKIQLRLQNKWFFQKLSNDFALDFAKKMNYDDDENETIFYSILKAAVWKLSKNLKTFNEIKNFSKRIFEMKKLIKNIENFDNLKKFRMFEKKMIFEIAIVDNRIKNMIKTMKKMILNVNVFMQKIVQHQKNQFRFFFVVWKCADCATFKSKKSVCDCLDFSN